MDLEAKREKIHRLFQMARKDPRYAAMTKEYNALEKKFSRMTQGLSPKDEDLAWAFVCVSDAMNYRMMELLVEIFDIE